MVQVKNGICPKGRQRIVLSWFIGLWIIYNLSKVPLDPSPGVKSCWASGLSNHFSSDIHYTSFFRQSPGLLPQDTLVYDLQIKLWNEEHKSKILFSRGYAKLCWTNGLIEWSESTRVWASVASGSSWRVVGMKGSAVLNLWVDFYSVCRSWTNSSVSCESPRGTIYSGDKTTRGARWHLSQVIPVRTAVIPAWVIQTIGSRAVFLPKWTPPLWLLLGASWI